MATTQDHLSIEDIKEDIVILKDGGMALVLETTAVNFGLLSENEQLAIISAFAALLNSLSFLIQIVIRSKRLDITAYLNLLSAAQKKQTNVLLSKLMANYRDFIEKIVRENQVLDKQFYIVIPLSYLEVGITRGDDEHFKKALTILLPRRDHIIRQLWRTGLKATQLNTKQLVELFYDIYNSPRIGVPAQTNLQISPQESLTKEKVTPTPANQPKQEELKSQASATRDEPQVQKVNVQMQTPQVPKPETNQSRSSNLATPFIVEELADEYGAV